MTIQIPESFDSKFRFIVVSAARAKHLLNGAPPKIEPKGRKPSTVAIREVEAGLIEYEQLPLDDDDAPAEDEE